MRWARFVETLLIVLCLAGTAPGATYFKGDVDGDGDVDAGDAAAVARILSGAWASPPSEALEAADVAPRASGAHTGTGVSVDAADLMMFLRALDGDDLDQDGLADDLGEGASPFLSDTDSDGMSDSAEVTNGTDPADEDSDDDGLTDGEEDTHGLDPLTADFTIELEDPPVANPQEILVEVPTGWTDFTVVVNGLEQQIWDATLETGTTYRLKAALFHDTDNQIYVQVRKTGLSNSPVGITPTETGVSWSQSGSFTIPATVSGDLVVTPGPSPAPFAVSDLTISSGAFLVLMPGVEIEVGQKKKITVSGDFFALGTVADPVLLTRAASATSSRGTWWNGIKLQSGGLAHLSRTEIKYLRSHINVPSGSELRVLDSDLFEYGASGSGTSNHAIQVPGGTATLERITAEVSRLDSANIIRFTGGDGSVSDSIFKKNYSGNSHGGSAVGVTSGTPRIEGNSISGHWSNGVWVEGASPEIVGNTFSDPTVHSEALNNGIHILPTGGTAYPTITDNHIMRVEPTNAECDSGTLRVGIRIRDNAGGIVQDNLIESGLNKGCGMRLGTLTSNSVISGNTIRGYESGIRIIGGGYEVENNTIEGAINGIKISFNATVDVVGNYISGNTRGIWLISNAGSPTINGENIITLNDGGVLIEGSNSASSNPSPILTNNNIYWNRNYNLKLEDMTNGSGSLTLSDVSGNYWGSTDTQVIEAGFVVDPDVGVPIYAPLDVFGGASVIAATNGTSVQSASIISGEHLVVEGRAVDPWVADSLKVSFTLLASAAETKLGIVCRLADNPSCASSEELVREVSVSNPSVGPVELSWDGKDTQGGPVEDGVYFFTLDVGTSLYDPAAPSQTFTWLSSGACGAEVTCGGAMNPYRNEYWKGQATWDSAMEYPAKVRARLCLNSQACTSGNALAESPEQVLAEDFPVDVLFDGRDSNGVLADLDSSTFKVVITDPVPISENFAVVSGGAPEITGELASPDIEVKVSPYYAYETYDELARMRFQIDRDSQVTVKILPVGEGDPSQSIATVFDQAVDADTLYDAVWRMDLDDLTLNDPGAYTFHILAEALDGAQQPNGHTTEYRGVIQVVH